MRIAAWKRTFLIAATIAPMAALAPVAHAQPAGAKPAAGAEPSEAAVKKATAAFTKGSDLFKAKKYQQALDQFKESYAAVASPNSHLYIARCLRELGDNRAAYLEFGSVIAEAEARKDKYGQTGDTAKVEQDQVAAKIALVTISVTGATPGSTVHIGADNIPREQWDKPIPLAPGTVDATLENNGKQAAKQSLTLAAGDKKTVSLEALVPTPPGGGGDTGGGGGDTGGGDTGGPKKAGMSPLRAGGIAAAGVGVAGFIMFAVAGSMSKSTYSDLQTKCGMGPCPANLGDEVSRGRTQQTLANVGLIVGAVGVAAGATLIGLSFRKGKTEAPPPAASLVVSPGYVSVKGSF